MNKSLQEEREENLYYDLLRKKEADDLMPEEVRLKQLENQLKECDKLLERYEPVIKSVARLKEKYDEGVSKKISSLHESIESLLSSQHGLIVASEKIDQSLVYFNELESMKARLSNPSHLILNESLVPTLNKLTECINFMESNPSYKDSQEFLINYRHLQAQVLSMIRNYIINSIESTTKAVQPDSGDNISEGDSVFTLFYGRYQFNSHRIKSLAQLLEERVSLSENYRKLLDECHESYFKSREILMGPVLSAALDEMVSQCLRPPQPSHGQSGEEASKTSEVTSGTAKYSELLRNSSRMLLHICKDEHHLFFQFFTQNTDQLE